MRLFGGGIVCEWVCSFGLIVSGCVWVLLVCYVCGCGWIGEGGGGRRRGRGSVMCEWVWMDR